MVEQEEPVFPPHFQGSDSVGWNWRPHLHPIISLILFWPELSQMKFTPGICLLG